MNGRQPFGIVGAFDTSTGAVETARALRDVGLHAVDAYTPYPVEEFDAALHPGRKILLPVVMAIGAVAGAAGGYFIQYWGEAVGYPLNVGGRPYNSWPAFIVSAFEITLLFAVAAGFFGLWAACRLPLLHHPIFDADGIERASRDRFLLCVEARDPGFDPEEIRRIFERHGAAEIVEGHE